MPNSRPIAIAGSAFEDVDLARHGEAQLAEHAAVRRDPRNRAEISETPVARDDIRRPEPERQRPGGAPPLADRAGARIVVADQDEPLRRDAIEERFELRDERRDLRVAIDVIVLDVREDGDLRAQFQERAVRFVALADEPLARADARVRPGIDAFAADDDRRVDPARFQDAGRHRRRRRLPVRPGDRDPALRRHQLGEQRPAAQDLQALRARGEHLGILLGDRGADDHARRGAEVRRRVADRDPRAFGPQAIGERRRAVARAADALAALQQDARERAHADSADPDEVH